MQGVSNSRHLQCKVSVVQCICKFKASPVQRTYNSKTSVFQSICNPEVSTIQAFEQRNSKLPVRTMLLCSMYPFKYDYHLPNFLDLWSCALGRLPLFYIHLSMCPFIWNSHFFYLQNFFYL